MNLQCIQYFLEIASCGNFTKAAERLYITQPTLSRQIADLERELGVELFNRQGRSISLTAAGEIFKKEALEIVTRCDNLPALIQKSASAVTGSVTIGFQDHLDASLISDVMKRISAEYPEINIIPRRYGFGDLDGHLRKNQEDIIITLASLLPPLPDIVSHRLQANSLMLAVPTSHPLAQTTEPVEIKSLSQETFVLMERSVSPATVDCAISLCAKAGFSPRTHVYCQDGSLVLLNVSSGKGIGFIFERVYNPYPESVRFLKIADETPDFDVVLAYRKSAANLAVKTVIDEFLKLAP